MPTKRKTLARNIYEDKNGVSIFVNGSEKGNRFPLGTPLGDLIRARDRLEETAALEPRLPRKGTLRQDVAAYLATLPADITTGIERRRRRSDAKRLLERWLSATTEFHGKTVTFGDLPRNAISSVMIRAQLAEWRSDGMSESYCDHHRRELGTLYYTLNGKDGKNPVRAVPKFAPKYTDPRGFDLAVMDLIIDSMPDRGKPPKGSRKKDGTLPTVNQSKIRLRVLRHCGIPPQVLRQVQPHDIHFGKATLATKQRRKGGGAEARVIPISDQAVAALRDFHKHRLYGWFDQSSLNQAFKRAAMHFRAAWRDEHPDEPCPVPDDLHAYDLRHCFGSHLFRLTGDKKTVSHLLIHAPGSTATDRYMQAAVPDVARAAIAKVNSQALPNAPKKDIKFPMNRKKTGVKGVA